MFTPFTPVPFARWLAGVLACVALGACGDHDEAALSASAPPATVVASPATTTAAPSDIQQWAAQQTGATPSPATLTLHSSITDAPVSASAPDPLLPPVIHEVE